MRLQILSDLHLELEPFGPLGLDVDAVVLAGDIATGTGGVDWARGWAQDRPVLYVAGNHGFYGHALPGLIDQLRGAAAGSSVRVLAGAFASDVTDLMGADRVAVWIYAHTHRVADLVVRGTRVVSNPRGYPHQPVAGFDPTCVVEPGRSV